MKIVSIDNENYDDDDIENANDNGNGNHNLVSHLVLIGLEQDAHPVRVVVHGEVCEPGAGVRVDHDLVPADAVDHDALASHRVLVVVLVVLVEDGGDLLTVLADGQQSLLVVVGGDMELGGENSVTIIYENLNLPGTCRFRHRGR